MHSIEHRILTNKCEDRIEKSLTVWFLGRSNGFIGIKEDKNTLRRVIFMFCAVISLNGYGGLLTLPTFFRQNIHLSE